MNLSNGKSVTGFRVCVNVCLSEKSLSLIYLFNCLSPKISPKMLELWWPKSNVPKVRAYYSAADHLIRKIFSGVCRDIHWFEEYLKIIEIDDHFFE